MIAEVNNAQLAEYKKLAQRKIETMNRSIVELANANSRLAKAEAQTWDCTGELQIGAALVYTGVRIDDMRFESGETIQYDGSGWGVGLGASGSSLGSGIFNVSPSDLVKRKKVKMQVFFVTVGIGAVEVSFWNESGSEYLGVFVAGSLGAGLGSFGGDGEFENV